MNFVQGPPGPEGHGGPAPDHWGPGPEGHGARRAMGAGPGPLLRRSGGGGLRAHAPRDVAWLPAARCRRVLAVDAASFPGRSGG